MAANVLELVWILLKVVHLAKIDVLKTPISSRVCKFEVGEIGSCVLYPQANKGVVRIVFQVVILSWWLVDDATGRQVFDQMSLPPAF